MVSGNGQVSAPAPYAGIRNASLPVRLFPYGGTVYQPVFTPLPAAFELVFCLKAQLGDSPVTQVLNTNFGLDSVNECYVGTVKLKTAQIVAAFVGAAAVNSQAGANYAVALSDKGNLVNLTDSSATNVILPADSTAFAVNDTLWLMAGGTGAITATGASGVTVTPVGGVNALLSPGVPVLAIKTAANTWQLRVPTEADSITLVGQWAWADTAAADIDWVYTNTFPFIINNAVYTGAEGTPADTANPTQYALASWVSANFASASAITSAVNGLAPLNSPALTGAPTAPTASAGTNTTQLATTAFVQAAVPSLAGYATTSAVTTAVGAETTRATSAEAGLVSKLGTANTQLTAFEPAQLTFNSQGQFVGFAAVLRASLTGDNNTGATTADNSALGLTIPANTLRVGDVITFEMSGLVANGTTASTLNLWLMVNGIKSAGLAFAMGTTAHAAAPWRHRGQLIIRAIGASGSGYLSNEGQWLTTRSLNTNDGQVFSFNTTLNINLTIGGNCTVATGVSLTAKNGYVRLN